LRHQYNYELSVMCYPLVCVITVDKSTGTGHIAGMGGARLGKQF